MPPSEATIQYPVDGAVPLAPAGAAAPEVRTGARPASATATSATKLRRRREKEETYMVLRSAQAEEKRPRAEGVTHVNYALIGQNSCPPLHFLCRASGGDQSRLRPPLSAPGRRRGSSAAPTAPAGPAGRGRRPSARSPRRRSPPDRPAPTTAE